MSAENNSRTGTCCACEGTVSKYAALCPHCGQKKPYKDDSRKHGFWTWVFIIVGAFIAIGQISESVSGPGSVTPASSRAVNTDLEFAIRKCEAGIRASVNNPSTVDLHRFTGFGNDVTADGTRRITQTFSAKNSFGLKQTYDAYCLLKPDGKFDIRIKEQGR